MKFYLLFILLFLSIKSFAVEAPGKVFYLIPQRNEIVKREMTIRVPSRGEGEVALITSSGKEIKTKKYWTRKKLGRTIFYAYFKGLRNPTDRNSPATSMLFRGSYIRGSNMAVYYGDIYLGGLGLKDEQIKKMKFFRHAGGFAFKSEI